MHHGNMATSKRLQDTYAALADRQWHSTWHIAQATHSCAVHSDIAALRENGCAIDTQGPKLVQGCRIYEYRLRERLEESGGVKVGELALGDAP